MIKEFHALYNNFFALISKTYILGVIPLDTTLHIVVGFLITFIGLRMGYKFWKVFLFLFVLESIKAIHASFTIDHDILHGLKEFFATFIYPAWVYLVRRIKEKGSRNQKVPGTLKD